MIQPTNRLSTNRLWATGSSDDESDSRNSLSPRRLDDDDIEFEEESSASPVRKRGRDPDTPTKKVEDLVNGIKTWDPAQPLESPQKRVVRRALDAVKEAPDTPNRQKQAKLACLVADAGLDRITGDAEYAPDSPGYHAKVVRNLSGWTAGVTGEAAQLANRAEFRPRRRPIGPFINIDHITTINQHDDKVSGCHWLAPDSPVVRQVTAQNPNTGVLCGFVIGASERKYSSFFPDTIRTEQELIKFIEDGEILYECENLQIRRKNELHYMCYLRNKELEIRSAFPIFIFETWEPNRTYTITNGCTISSQEVLDAYKTLKNNQPSPVQMQVDAGVIIDIAAAIPTKNAILKGVLFLVPETKLYRL